MTATADDGRTIGSPDGYLFAVDGNSEGWGQDYYDYMDLWRKITNPVTKDDIILAIGGGGWPPRRGPRLPDRLAQLWAAVQQARRLQPGCRGAAASGGDRPRPRHTPSLRSLTQERVGFALCTQTQERVEAAAGLAKPGGASSCVAGVFGPQHVDQSDGLRGHDHPVVDDLAGALTPG